ncbi:salt stress protein, Slr1339 family [Calothrix sp. UHCC 0171]|uniref:salt stress protein, Slr1339 family n=1 Tax=Calothrix sp. UHCC 0171 TaxID=3110245 RepID=UPI002B2169A0|nr:hypothetical protein [Calothrix sp. UHCC 0171]MEA5572621.1 hypothetical protein [Calothrix sp. UHCC 0171]
MDEIDKLLQELQQEYSENKPKPQSPNYPKSTQSTPVNSGVDKMLNDIKADFEEKDLAEKLQQQQLIEAERIRQKQALEKTAKLWLEKLEPLSQEGLWFDKFAEGYPSKLAAAIEYLQGLETES